MRSAKSKIAALTGPPAAALPAAASRTFSKTRGTPRMMFGEYRANCAETVEKSASELRRACFEVARGQTCALADTAHRQGGFAVGSSEEIETGSISCARRSACRSSPARPP